LPSTNFGCPGNALEYELFRSKLQMPSQIVQVEASKHGLFKGWASNAQAIRPGRSAWAWLFENKHQMPDQFVWEEAPEHGLFALDKLQMPRQFIRDEALEHELFENEHQMLNQFVWDEAPEHELFALDKLQMPRQFVVKVGSRKMRSKARKTKWIRRSRGVGTRDGIKGHKAARLMIFKRSGYGFLYYERAYCITSRN